MGPLRARVAPWCVRPSQEAFLTRPDTCLLLARVAPRRVRAGQDAFLH
eukprot:CAMPEP_0204357460 /NCGR_PEP_ID=MMETSP0469-20131031/35756_1 /ASSEMBLY_ACC=CAM_ASM_000384 /TAXON_ID=2969 /ORGANISM="Oxyrrhis marina" /LENGTH=47 /DNA_ID= /DNA_START= /DNA_END= /DNA_ORIENTATION=